MVEGGCFSVCCSFLVSVHAPQEAYVPSVHVAGPSVSLPAIAIAESCSVHLWVSLGSVCVCVCVTKYHILECLKLWLLSIFLHTLSRLLEVPPSLPAVLLSAGTPLLTWSWLAHLSPLPCASLPLCRACPPAFAAVPLSYEWNNSLTIFPWFPGLHCKSWFPPSLCLELPGVLSFTVSSSSSLEV